MAKNFPIDKNLYWVMRVGAMVGPTVLMLCHWVLTLWWHGVADGKLCVEVPWVTGVALWAMAYAVPAAMLLPAVLFFGHGRVWRIPFVYLLGVSAVRIACGEMFMNEWTETGDYAMIVLTLLLYGVWAARRSAVRERDALL